MAGGYVKWDDEESDRTILSNKPRGSKVTYTFPKGEWIRVEDEVDWKFYEWKEKRDPAWMSKRRLSAKDGISFEQKNDERPTVDKLDPYFKDDKRRKEVYEDYMKKKEEMRKYFGGTLPEALKKAKKIYGGD